MHKLRTAGGISSSIDAAIAELAAAFGNHLVTSQAVRAQHANTTTWIAPHRLMPWSTLNPQPRSGPSSGSAPITTFLSFHLVRDVF